MQRIVLPLAATLIWAAAASPSPASASPQDHVKARHVKRIQAHSQKKAPRVVKKTQRVVEKANEHGLVQAEPIPGAVHAIAQAKLDPPDTANPLVALAMSY